MNEIVGTYLGIGLIIFILNMTDDTASAEYEKFDINNKIRRFFHIAVAWPWFLFKR